MVKNDIKPVMQAGATLIKEIGRLKPAKEWSFAEAKRADTNAFSHGYHRYPAKFIPQIVEKLIMDYTLPGELVFDPFGGCGTTLVEAKLLGRRSVGFDINPIAKLITQTKITPIKPRTLENSLKKFLKNYENSTGIKYEHHPRINYWFDEVTLKELDRIYSAIEQIKDRNVRRFFICGFSHILKNCSRWLMKSIKPTVDKDKAIPLPLEPFVYHIKSMIKKNSAFYSKLKGSGNLDMPARMYRKDSTRKMFLKDNSVDLIVTSPPYVTSYEYADLHQLSLLWLGDDPRNFKKWHKFSNEYDDFRKTFIGTSIQTNLRARNIPVQSTLAEEIVSRLANLDKSLAGDVANYFRDMKLVFSELHRILKPSGKLCVIIGNTLMKGVEIENAQVAAQQMAALGFEKVELVKREITNKMISPWRDSNSGKFTGLNNPSKKRVYQYEYILVMQK